MNWLFRSFAAFFQTGLVVVITVVAPPHPADTARLACHPSPGRAASHSLVCEQMDIVAVDAFAAFIIVYTLFIVVVLPINLFVRTTRPSVLPRINSWLPSLFPSLCVSSDKLAVPLSSPVVTLDKLKLTHQSFCPLLYSTSTRYKTIILELVRNSSGH